MFVATSILLSRQKTCLSRLNVCRDKNYTCGSDSGVPLWKLVPLSDGSWEEGISEDFGFGAKQAFSQADVV